MRANEDLCLKGKQVLLAPYEKEFVPLYHTWMQNKTLLEQTATEPLSLKEEYENQISWREDPHKCSFIIIYIQQEQPQQIVGDVNAFLLQDEDSSAVEVEVMIAETSYRRLGLATEAVQLLLLFVNRYLGLNTFIAKIATGNTASLGLFRRLGFEIYRQVPVFSEVHLRKTDVDPVEVQLGSWKRDWYSLCKHIIPNHITTTEKEEYE
ncbi:N-acetyltransferase 9 [Galdieria sulphuraria]|nr:N-acetyltransferase 9 [Galdieria sulphuraria]